MTGRKTSVTAKELKVRTGAVLGRVAEGAVVYVTHRGKSVARLEPLTARRGEQEVVELDRLIDRLHGKYDWLPSSEAFLRARRREDRSRSRR